MFSILPAGYYKGKIFGHDLVSVGEKETPAVLIDLKIESGVEKESKAVVDLPSECFRKATLWLTDSAFSYTVEALQKLGFKGEMKLLEMENEEQSGLVGLPVSITIKHQEYNGKIKERISIYPPKEDNNKKLKAVNAKALAGAFAQKQKELLGNGGDDEMVEDNYSIEEEEEVVAPPPKSKTKKVAKTFRQPTPVEDEDDSPF